MRRKPQVQDLEQSDEEVLSYQSDVSDDEQEDEGDNEEEENETWGDYYNADVIETEADALEEEAEARRLQQKQLQAISDADFGLENWTTGDTEVQATANKNGTVVVEKLPEPKLPPNATVKDKLDILHARYPEFEPLVRDFQDLQRMWTQLDPKTIKFQALSSYLGAIAMYFAVLTTKVDLREHAIIATLIRTRQAWNAVKDISMPEEHDQIEVKHEKSISESTKRRRKRKATKDIEPVAQRHTVKRRR